MLKANDEFVMVKPIGNLEVGTRFRVVEIKDEIIYFVSEGLGMGFMTQDEFPRYFKVVRKWTPWVLGGLFEYRTDNSRYVEVRKLPTREKKRASCHPLDDFDLLTGITVALNKLTDYHEI